MIALYATRERRGGNEFVWVDPGSEAYDYWRGQGYAEKKSGKSAVAETAPAAVVAEEVEVAAPASAPDPRTELDGLDLEGLRARWAEVHGEAPHPRLGRERLIAEIMAPEA